MSRLPRDGDDNIYTNDSNENSDEWSSDLDDEEDFEDEENYENLELPEPPAKLPPRPAALPLKADTEPSLPPLPPRGSAPTERASSIKDALQAALISRQILGTAPTDRPLPAAPSMGQASQPQRSLPPIPPSINSQESLDDTYELPDERDSPAVTMTSTRSRALPPPPSDSPKQLLSTSEDDDDYTEPDDIPVPKLAPVMGRPIPLPPLPEPPAGVNPSDNFGVYETGDLYSSEQPSASIAPRPPALVPSKLSYSPSDPRTRKELHSARTNAGEVKSMGSKASPFKSQAAPQLQPAIKNCSQKFGMPSPVSQELSEDFNCVPSASNKYQGTGGAPKLDVPIQKPFGRKSPVPESDISTVSVELLSIKGRLKPVETVETVSTILAASAGKNHKSSPVAKTEVQSSEVSENEALSLPKKPAADQESRSTDCLAYRSRSPCTRSQDMECLAASSVNQNREGRFNSRSPSRAALQLPTIPPTSLLPTPPPRTESPSPAGITSGSKTVSRPTLGRPVVSDVLVTPTLADSLAISSEAKPRSKLSGAINRGESLSVSKTQDREFEMLTGSRRPSAPAMTGLSRADTTIVKAVARPLPPVPSATEMAREELSSYSWFVGGLDRKKSEATIGSFNVDGAFVVRTSQNGGERNPFALTLLFRHNPYNLHIRKRNDGMFAIGNEKPDEIVFQTVPELIRYYQNNKIDLIGDSRRNIAPGRVTLKVCSPQ